MAAKKLAFVFPGQGAQVVGMGKDLAEHSPEMLHYFEEAEKTIGWPIGDIMFNGPEDELKETKNAQPALFLLEVALLRALTELEVKPTIVAGHSVGEYAAYVAAEVIDYGHALWLVKQRGTLMGEAGTENPGGMVAVIGLDDNVVEAVCNNAGGNVWVANYNSPGQVVITGDHASLEKAMELCKEAGAKRCVKLPVSGAFHSRFLENSAEALAENMDRVAFFDAKVPVVTNYDGLAHTSGEILYQNLVKQMTSSVRWTQTMQTIAASGIEGIVEIGPSAVLSGLAKRTMPDIPTYHIGNWNQLKEFTGANI